MSANDHLRRATSAIETARKKLKRLPDDAKVDLEYEVRRVIRELDTATTEIRRAAENLPS